MESKQIDFLSRRERKILYTLVNQYKHSYLTRPSILVTMKSLEMQPKFYSSEEFFLLWPTRVGIVQV